MLIEIKTKAKRTADGREKTFTEYYLTDAETFPEAALMLDRNMAGVPYEIIYMKLSQFSELYEGAPEEVPYAASLLTWFEDDSGNVKPSRYKILVWSDTLAHATDRVNEISSQGYDMAVEGIKKSQFTYIHAQ